MKNIDELEIMYKLSTSQGFFEIGIWDYQFNWLWEGESEEKGDEEMRRVIQIFRMF